MTCDTIKLLSELIPELGVLTTKSIGPDERDGNREPVIAKVVDESLQRQKLVLLLEEESKENRSGDDHNEKTTEYTCPSIVNAVGLANPGVDLFVSELQKMFISEEAGGSGWLRH